MIICLIVSESHHEPTERAGKIIFECCFYLPSYSRCVISIFFQAGRIFSFLYALQVKELLVAFGQLKSFHLVKDSSTGVSKV